MNSNNVNNFVLILTFFSANILFRSDDSPGQNSPRHIPDSYSNVLIELSKVESEIKSVAMSLSHNEKTLKKEKKEKIKSQVKSKISKSKKDDKIKGKKCDNKVKTI